MSQEDPRQKAIREAAALIAQSAGGNAPAPAEPVKQQKRPTKRRREDDSSNAQDADAKKAKRDDKPNDGGVDLLDGILSNIAAHKVPTEQKVLTPAEKERERLTKMAEEAERAKIARFKADVDRKLDEFLHSSATEVTFPPCPQVDRYIINESAEEKGLEAASYRDARRMPPGVIDSEIKCVVVYKKDVAPTKDQVLMLRDHLAGGAEFVINGSLALIASLEKKRNEVEEKKREAASAASAVVPERDYHERLSELTTGYDQLQQTHTGPKRDLRTIEQVQMDMGAIPKATISDTRVRGPTRD